MEVRPVSFHACCVPGGFFFFFFLRLKSTEGSFPQVTAGSATWKELVASFEADWNSQYTQPLLQLYPPLSKH